VAVFPSKAILENSLTALVAGIYLVCISILFKLAAWIGSSKSESFVLLIALVTVTVVALSDRVRMHTRRFISRYFQRPFYDYRTVWRTLTEGIASRVKQPDLCQSAVTLISEIFQVLSATIWLVDEKRENLVFAGSPHCPPPRARRFSPKRKRLRRSSKPCKFIGTPPTSKPPTKIGPWPFGG